MAINFCANHIHKSGHKGLRAQIQTGLLYLHKSLRIKFVCSSNSRLRMEGFNLICLRAPPRLLERVGLRKNMWVLLRAMLAHRESQCEPKLESMPPHVVGVVYNFDPTTPFRERHIRLNRSVHSHRKQSFSPLSAFYIHFL